MIDRTRTGEPQLFGIKNLFGTSDTAKPDFRVAYGKDWLSYSEAGRTMLITANAQVGELTLQYESIAHWIDAPDTRIADSERRRILKNITTDLEARGITVQVAK